ncbi:prephenate/arogenate dehydrogenase [Geminocystis sp. NIES-3709]|uniref:prephenate/arogenate dehydrogenase n=1 Tax=Geminocystis sp. NIES-3709 TaxID=1617448 RepID=UPI0005FC7A4F|nr:prephenate/arogenate dehydrogenase [Geminocystis sp. NIES-3709]BAQ65936.1 arogenate dehydrogenase [Geminocystis sp. NIES-3709]
MKIGIVGLGLIGGSLGLDLTRLGYHVIGVSRQLSTCNIALERNIVTQAEVDFAILEQTDLIFICTPIESILPSIENIIKYLSPQTIITDVGSVKGSIVHQGTQLWQNFVGSHPMAGTANQGVESAEFDLFKNAPCVLTPIRNTSLTAMETVAKIWTSIGCKMYNSTPEIHDRAVAWISHLPVMISANLIYSCINNGSQELVKLSQNLASSGFRDTSRVGGGNVELGLMMAQYNRYELLNCLKEYQQNLSKIIENIEQEKWTVLEDILTKTKEERPNFLK